MGIAHAGHDAHVGQLSTRIDCVQCACRLTAREPHLKAMFKIMIACTLGAFRAVSRGVADGTIKAPWKTGYASFMTLPPLLLLSYFAFMF